jgi:hypothetical protein
MTPHMDDESIGSRHFVGVRRHGGSSPPRDAGNIIRFQRAEQARGPLTFGYGCHFGLGSSRRKRHNQLKNASWWELCRRGAYHYTDTN